MNCTQLRNRLPELLYEHLSAADRQQLQEHLAQCPECRNEYASLQKVQQALNRVSVPEVSVNLPLLYQQVADRQTRATRRWRKLALAVGGIAAGVFLVLALRLEIRLGREQIVIRWGGATPDIDSNMSSERERTGLAKDFPSPATEAELQPLRGMIYALDENLDKLSREVETRNQRQQQGMARLQDQLTQFRIVFQRQMALSLADASKKGDDR